MPPPRPDPVLAKDGTAGNVRIAGATYAPFFSNSLLVCFFANLFVFFILATLTLYCLEMVARPPLPVSVDVKNKGLLNVRKGGAPTIDVMENAIACAATKKRRHRSSERRGRGPRRFVQPRGHRWPTPVYHRIVLLAI